MENLEEREEMERTGNALRETVMENRWCYTGPDLESEWSQKRASGGGAVEAAYTWARYAAHWRTETDRMRYCQGCRFLQTAGPSLVCGYLLCTGRRRPCRFGGPCAAKALICGYQLPPDYEKKLLAADRSRIMPEEAPVRNPPGKRGPKLKWDEGYAMGLFRRGYRLNEISEIMGVPYGNLLRIGTEHGWFKPGPRGPQKRRNLDCEKARFQEHKRQRENDGK